MEKRAYILTSHDTSIEARRSLSRVFLQLQMPQNGEDMRFETVFSDGSLGFADKYCQLHGIIQRYTDFSFQRLKPVIYRAHKSQGRIALVSLKNNIDTHTLHHLLRAFDYQITRTVVSEDYCNWSIRG